jgi:amino acid transporter
LANAIQRSKDAAGPPAAYGLRAGALGPLETLAQSVSATSPSTGSALTIPLVFALAGNGTWLVYLLATGAVLLVAWCVSRFARVSASPGSLYSYAADSLPPVCGAMAGWGLLMAYVATGASVAGGAMYYCVVLAQDWLHVSPAVIPVLAVICAGAGYIAYRDIKLSAAIMLWIEFASLLMMVVVLVLLLARSPAHIDLDQLRLRGLDAGSVGPVLVLAIFTFVGFESATTLGVEARQPLRTIPRAVLQCAMLSGAFFMLCSYTEVLGFRGMPSSLSETSSPVHLLAQRAGVPALAVAMEAAAMISMFSCALACATAAARVLLRMAREGLVPDFLQRTSTVRGTPAIATALACTFMFGASAAMALRGVTGYEMYDLGGSMAVCGFLTAYALVAIAAPFATRSSSRIPVGTTIVSGVTLLVIVAVAVLDIQSSTDAVHARIPYFYVGYLGLGVAVYFGARQRQRVPLERAAEPEG